MFNGASGYRLNYILEIVGAGNFGNETLCVENGNFCFEKHVSG